MIRKIKEFSNKIMTFCKLIVLKVMLFFELIKIEIFSLKDNIVLFLKVFLLSAIFFAGIKNFITIAPLFYTVVLVLIWFILLLDFSFEIEKNKSRIEEFLVSTVANIAVFLLWRVYSDNEYKNWCDIKLILILILYFGPLYVFSLKNIVLNKKKDEELFEFRKKDLKRAIKLLDLNVVENLEGEKIENKREDNGQNILGIESVWGNGKTFFVQNLKEKLGGDQYSFIEIDVLAYNLDELPNVLVKELEKVLYNNHIMSKYSSRLKNFFEKEKRLDILYRLFGGKQYSYAETFRGFKEELKKIDKTIFIIYEDIDRIIDRRLIKKIFYISEKLSCENIKIVYQYSMNRLEKMGFDKAYVDKYIPSTIALSDISLEEVRNSKDHLKTVITNEDLLLVDPEKFLNILDGSVYLLWRRDDPLISMKKVYDFLQNCYNIRTINHFFYDIKNMIV